MKKRKPLITLLLFVAAAAGFGQSDNSYGNYVVIQPNETSEQIIKKAANVTPSPRQYEWQKMEMTGFVHFGINTFDEVEWGQRTTDITKFNPQEIDVHQWVKVFKEAGFKLIILTCKHHDGFCLWPSKFSDYTITHTPFQKGKGDIVRDLSQACKEAGIKFGVYLSPWDMHDKSYGTPEYNTYFLNLLTELLTNYGKISEVWFDGANGEGPNGRKQVYDWQSYYQLIRKLQPNAVIAVSGPDVRWVGTESGYGRQTEWSVLPGTNADQNAIAANSQQQSLDGAFVPHDLMDEDLGSREKIKTASSLVWYPAEIDVSIRPRWFYNSGDDYLVKSPEKLVDIYYNSVGLNGVLLLNVPPDKRGLIYEQDVKNLKRMRYILDETFKENLTHNSTVTATSEKRENRADAILDDNLQTYWTTDDTTSTASLDVTMSKVFTFNRAMLQENILVGQRIEKFHIDWWNNNRWEKLAEGTTVGYKRLFRFPEVTTDKVKIVIEQSRTNPTLSSFGLYEAPPEINFHVNEESFADSTTVEIHADGTGNKIFYTMDGSLPNSHSAAYALPLQLSETKEVTAIAISNEGKISLPQSVTVHKAKCGIHYNIPFNLKYPAAGKYALVDGVKGVDNFADGNWQGFEGTDVDVVLDCRKKKPVHEIEINFLREINSYIFLPESVQFFISDDGEKFTSIGECKNDSPQNEKAAFIKSFTLHSQNISGKFIRVVAKNIGVCPAWHKGAGAKAWMFCDEISVK